MTDAGSSYLLLDRIAAGGMAEVYRAKSLGVEGFEKIVALKRILPALAQDAEFVKMFIHEAKIAGQLSHANIASIIELGRIGDTHFIAMEYVWGKDLRRILARFKHLRQPMPPPMAAWITAKMLEALDHAHRKRGADGRPLGIIHRDVSPQNVLVSYDGLVKLIDFGIAKAASRADQTRAGVIKGKLAYMSPEQVRGLPIDHRSDVFAAAACFHELLTGERAFEGPSDIDVIDKVREARCDPPSKTAPHVPPALDAIVMKGLARDVSARYQTAEEMHEAIIGFIASSRPPYGTSDLSRWMRIAFAPEMAAEREHLEQLLSVSSPGVPVSSGEPVARTSSPEGPIEELSQIVMVEELELERSSLAPVAAPDVPPYVPPELTPPPYEAPAPPVPQPAPISAAPISQPPPALKSTMAFSVDVAAMHMQHAAAAPHVPTPMPAQPAAQSPAAHSPATQSGPIGAPRVSAEALGPRPSHAAPEHKKRSRWPVVALVLVLLLLGGAGGAVWILRFGGRAILGI